MAPASPPAESVTATATAVATTTTTTTTATPLDRPALLDLIRRHGGTILAYSKLQPGLEHFHVPGLGAISYCMMQVGPPFLFKNRPACLGDPLCADADRAELTRGFLQKHPRAFFVQVSRDYALLLSRDFGLRATCMGGETELDVAGGYDLSGAAKHPLRNAAAAAEREGVYVRELFARGGVGRPKDGPWGHDGNSHHDDSDDESGEEVQRGLRAVDAAWAQTKGEHHAARIWFINRAPVFDQPEPGVRKFVAWHKRQPSSSAEGEEKTKMVAFVFFDPVYREGRVAGAYANVTRLDPSAPAGCLNLIVREALAKFRRELEREALALESAAARENGGDVDDDGGEDDLSRALDQQQQQHWSSSLSQPQQQQQPQKPSRKERLALKAAALAARGLSADELRAQRAAKKAGTGGPSAAAAPLPTKAAPAPAPRPARANANANAGGGKRLPPFFVSLGMAPFYALSAPAGDELPGEPSATRVMGWVYEHGQTFYPYQAIAFSKTRYGGGLDEAKRAFPRDPCARWRPVYAASSLDAPTFVALFDLGALVGFWKGPFNAIGTFVRYEWAGLLGRVAARFRSGGGRKGGGDGGARPAAPSSAAAAAAAAAAGAAVADSPAAPSSALPAPQPPRRPAALDAAPRTPSFASAASSPGSGGSSGGGGGSGDGGPVDAVFSFSEDAPPAGGKLFNATAAPRSDVAPLLDA